MVVSSYLRASVCLTSILVLLSTSSTIADVTSACQNSCSGPEGQTGFIECVFKCKEILSYYAKQLETDDEIPAENEEEYEDPTEELGSEETVGLQLRGSRPSRNDRALRRANLLLSRFVRYGRNQQHRPKYPRIGRSGASLSGGDFEEEAAKRASRFVRIGKSDVFDAAARNGAEQFEVDKKNNKRPSKYVRIGKRSD